MVARARVLQSHRHVQLRPFLSSHTLRGKNQEARHLPYRSGGADHDHGSRGEQRRPGGNVVGKTHPNVQRQSRENRRLTLDESTVKSAIDQQEGDDGACAVDLTAGWFIWVRVQSAG